MLLNFTKPKLVVSLSSCIGSNLLNFLHYLTLQLPPRLVPNLQNFPHYLTLLLILLLLIQLVMSLILAMPPLSHPRLRVLSHGRALKRPTPFNHFLRSFSTQSRRPSPHISRAASEARASILASSSRGTSSRYASIPRAGGCAWRARSPRRWRAGCT